MQFDREQVARTARPRIGVLCNWPPVPVRSGSNRRLAEMLQSLRQGGWRVDLVIVGAKRRNDQLHNYADRVFYFFEPGVLARIKSLYWLIGEGMTRIGLPHLDNMVLRLSHRRGAGGTPAHSDYAELCHPAACAFVSRIARERHWGAVIVEYLWLQGAVEGLPRDILRIVDTHDVMHIRANEIRRSNGTVNFPIGQSEEAALLGRFDCVLAIQDAERSVFERLKRKYGLGYDLITAGVSGTGIREGGEDRRPLAAVPDGFALFVAGYSDLNVRGLKAFLCGIWNRVRADCPSARLVVCGGVCTAFPAAECPGVGFMGYVPDLRDFYAKSSVVVNPIWFGTGLKIKSVEAIANDKPLVTTPSGIEGMPGAVTKACAVAMDENDFAAKLLLLLTDPAERNRLSTQASNYRCLHLTGAGVYRELHQYLTRRLLPHSPSATHGAVNAAVGGMPGDS